MTIATRFMSAAAEDEVICVDQNDQCIGFMSMHEAHANGGVLHRAFSIFVFNSAQQLLMQQRTFQKYHFGGLWTNACCSHPRPGEILADAAHRRLQEELGFDTPLQEIFSFIYEAHDEDSGLTEREFDHVFIGHFDGKPVINEAEIAAWKWVDIDALCSDVQLNPERYTAWFRIALGRVITQVQNHDVPGKDRFIPA